MQLNVTLLSLCNFNISHLLTCPKTWGKGPKRRKNTKKWSFFISLSTPPCWLRLQSKLKHIGHPTTCSILIISLNSKKSYSLTSPTSWGKWPKRLNILKNDHFSCWSQSQSKSKSNGYATTCGTFTISCSSNITYYFTFPKTWGEGTNQKRSFSKTLNIPPCRSRS